LAFTKGPRGPRHPSRSTAGTVSAGHRPRRDTPTTKTGKPRQEPAGKPTEKPEEKRPNAARRDGARLARAPRPRHEASAAATGKPRARPAGKPAARPQQTRADTSPREGDRIAKLLARAGVASRRDVERMIADGRIALNGETVTTPATILTSLRGVTVDGKAVKEPEATRLFLFHKPAGLLTTAKDPRGRPTIYDRLPADLPRVMPVGRLDLNTEGLLLLTTDGGFKRQLELPASGVERTYRARAFGTVSQAQLEELIDGVEIEGMRYGRIDANLERRTGRNQWIEMTLTEGKNREVRRVLEHLGLEVSRLIRTRYGPFTLGDSKAGDIMEVKQAEIARFRKTLP